MAGFAALGALAGLGQGLQQIAPQVQQTAQAIQFDPVRKRIAVAYAQLVQPLPGGGPKPGEQVSPVDRTAVEQLGAIGPKIVGAGPVGEPSAPVAKTAARDQLLAQLQEDLGTLSQSANPNDQQIVQRVQSDLTQFTQRQEDMATRSEELTSQRGIQERQLQVQERAGGLAEKRFRAETQFREAEVGRKETDFRTELQLRALFQQETQLLAEENRILRDPAILPEDREAATANVQQRLTEIRERQRGLGIELPEAVVPTVTERTDEEVREALIRREGLTGLGTEQLGTRLTELLRDPRLSEQELGILRVIENEALIASQEDLEGPVIETAIETLPAQQQVDRILEQNIDQSVPGFLRGSSAARAKAAEQIIAGDTSMLSPAAMTILQGMVDDFNATLERLGKFPRPFERGGGTPGRQL